MKFYVLGLGATNRRYDRTLGGVEVLQIQVAKIEEF